MQSLTDDNASVRHKYINRAILIMITLAFVAENDMYYYFLNKVFALVTAC